MSDQTAWHSLHQEQVLEHLKTDGKGLDLKTVKTRQKEFGKNILPDPPKVSLWKIFFRQFADLLIVILMAAAIVSFFMHEWRDAIAIVVIVLLNGCLGFFQEMRAEQAMEALKKMMLMEAQVIRQGKRTVVDVAELVPGDLVVLEAGERVPADIYLLTANDCQVIEAALTGEAVPVNKKVGNLATNTALAERKNILYCGTALSNGTATGIVTDTGGQTEFGKIAALTSTTPQEPSPLQKQTAALAKKLGVLGGILFVGIVILGIFQGFSAKDMFMFGISLAVSAIPEGLPTVLTITLALGMRKMYQKRCLVRRLTATETLGAAGVICTDKTGTLTQNEMTVTTLVTAEPFIEKGQTIQVTGGGYEPQGTILLAGQDASTRPDVRALLEASVLCNHACVEQKAGLWTAIGDPTEAALVVAGMKKNITLRGLIGEATALGEISFDSDRKRMSMVWQREKEAVVYTKGAPEVVLAQCDRIMLGDQIKPLTAQLLSELEKQNQTLASEGIRVLAVANRCLEDATLPSEKWEEKLVFLGFVGITDPPREEAIEAVKAAHTAGIGIIVATGDNAITAGAIGKQIGLTFDKVITGLELDDMQDQDLYQVLENRDTLFARVSPTHKMRIAKACQTKGKICAMTGDGVNDAPALRQADVGIAMGQKGSDVAKGAADIILVDDRFSSLVAGIKEGRRQFANIRKFIWYMLCSNLGEVIILSASLFMGWKVLILLPVQVLWLNLVTDGATALALGFEKSEPGVMDHKPRDPKAALLPWNALWVLGGIGLYKAVMILGIFYYYWDILGGRTEQALLLAQTMALTGMVVFSKVNVFNFRSFQHPLKQIGFFSNPVLLLAVLGTFVIQAGAVYLPFLQQYLGTTPISSTAWLYLVLFALPLLLIGEGYKMIATRNKKELK